MKSFILRHKLRLIALTWFATGLAYTALAVFSWPSVPAAILLWMSGWSTAYALFLLHPPVVIKQLSKEEWAQIELKLMQETRAIAERLSAQGIIINDDFLPRVH